MSQEGHISELKRAGEAFDNCSNKTVDFMPTSSFSAMLGRDGRMLQVVCPRFPDGTEFLPEVTSSMLLSRQRVAQRLGCSACEFSRNPEEVSREAQVKALHEKIREIPGQLYINGHYSEAVIRSLITVKESLREVSGYETSAEAIGKGGLYFITPRGEHVEKAFQQAAQFSLMAVDNLRNVEAHSLPHENEVQQGAEYAYPRLMLCTLALNFLDNAEIRQ